MSVSSSTMSSQSALGTASLRKRFKMANVFPQCPSIRQKKKKNNFFRRGSSYYTVQYNTSCQEAAVIGGKIKSIPMQVNKKI